MRNHFTNVPNMAMPILISMLCLVFMLAKYSLRCIIKQITIATIITASNIISDN